MQSQIIHPLPAHPTYLCNLIIRQSEAKEIHKDIPCIHTLFAVVAQYILPTQN